MFLLSELCERIGGELIGDGGIRITGVNGLSEAGPTELSFFSNQRYRDQLSSTRAAAVLIAPQATRAPVKEGPAWVKVPDPYLAFAKLSVLFQPLTSPAAGVHPAAHVAQDAKVHPLATVLAGATIEAGAQIGARTRVYPGAYVGAETIVGEDCILYPNVTVRERCRIGSRVILHSGCVIGADGFGFAFDPQGPAHFKVPQAGIVRIEDDVEIGACSCVDRATLGETVIGRGAKIDNLVQIAHNVKVGPLSLICAQAGVSGSAEIGQGAVLAGQVGVVGHIRVGNLAKIGAQSGVAHDVEDGTILSGSPAFDHREWLKLSAALPQVPQLLKEVRQLRRRLDALDSEAKEK